MKKFYVASSFKNVANVRYVAQGLENEGYINTYDWTLNAKARDEKTVTLSDLKKIGQMEKEAVLDADVVVILLPGGKGTHIELGIAIGQAKKIFLHSPDGTVNHVETTSTFYHLPEVVKHLGTLDELLGQITGQERVGATR